MTNSDNVFELSASLFIIFTSWFKLHFVIKFFFSLSSVKNYNREASGEFIASKTLRIQSIHERMTLVNRFF